MARGTSKLISGLVVSRMLSYGPSCVLLRPFKAAGGQTEMVTPSSRYDTEDSVDQDPVIREQEQLRNQGLSLG